MYVAYILRFWQQGKTKYCNYRSPQHVREREVGQQREYWNIILYKLPPMLP